MSLARRAVLTALVAALLAVGCSLVPDTWPDRRDRTPDQMLEDVIRWQQRERVRMSTGVLTGECFTADQLQSFTEGEVPSRIVARLRQSKNFGVVADHLRALPHDRLVEAIRSARVVSKPTWRQMGFIDREGRGQTEAGQRAELMIAEAVADAFAAELGIRLPDVR